MTRRQSLLLVGGLVSLVAVALLLGASDLGRLREQAGSIRWGWAAVAGALAVGSYACIAGTQHALLGLLGARPPAWLYLRLSMVSVVVARTLRSGGTSGLAFLSIVLARHGVPVVTTLSMGLGTVLVNACVVLGFVAAGFALLMLQPEAASREATWGYALGAGVMTAGLGTAFLLLTREAPRRRVLRRVESVAGRLGRRFGHQDWGPRAHATCERLGEAARELMGRPARAWRAWSWAVARLLLSLLCLGACARACGVPVTASALLLAFTAMKMAGTVAFVPAGLGIVDGSLAGALTLLGTPYEAALLIAALHRVTYHVVPAAVAALLAGPLLREVVAARAKQRAGGATPEEAAARSAGSAEAGEEAEPPR